MVDVVKDSCIRVAAEMEGNGWMDCIFLVRKEDEEKAKAVLEKAWDDFWEQSSDWCYGDYLEKKLAEAGIAFESFYTNEEE